MSESDSATPFDFRSQSRAPIQIETHLLDWQSRACRLMTQKWAYLCGLSPQWDVSVPNTLECRTAELPKHSVVYRVQLEGQELPTLMVFPGPFAIALVKTILGESVEAMDDDRPLTMIEISLVEMFVAETIDAIKQAGVGAGYPACSIGPHNPDTLFVRIYPNESKLISLQFESAFSFGNGFIQWLWPESLADELFFESDDTEERDSQHKADLSNLAKRMRLDIRVQLGKVKMDISDLAELKSGDILVLDQPIDEPLDVSISGSTIMRAWPTRTGHQQSIQIEECI